MDNNKFYSTYEVWSAIVVSGLIGLGIGTIIGTIVTASIFMITQKP